MDEWALTHEQAIEKAKYYKNLYLIASDENIASKIEGVKKALNRKHNSPLKRIKDALSQLE